MKLSKYQIYFIDKYTMKDGFIIQKALNKDNAIDKFKKKYCNDYEIIRIIEE